MVRGGERRLTYDQVGRACRRRCRATTPRRARGAADVDARAAARPGRRGAEACGRAARARGAGDLGSPASSPRVEVDVARMPEPDVAPEASMLRAAGRDRAARAAARRACRGRRAAHLRRRKEPRRTFVLHPSSVRAPGLERPPLAELRRALPPVFLVACLKRALPRNRSRAEESRSRL